MKPPNLPFAWFLCLLCCASSGCGRFQFKESRIIQVASAETGRPMYYKLDVWGSTLMAKTHYRAGLYDAAAVDALTGQVTAADADDSIDHIVWSQRRQAVERILSKLYEIIENPDPNDSKIRQYRQSLDLALQSPYDLALSRRQKFLAVFSSNASIVATAVAEFAEDKRSEDALMMAIVGDKRRGYLIQKARTDQIQHIHMLLYSAQRDLKSLQKEPSAQVRCEAVTAILEDIASIDLP